MTVKRNYTVYVSDIKIPWTDMARMRDKVSHAYFGIRYEIVWNVINERLPKIKPILI